MPTYVFRCEGCQTVFERFISFANLANAPEILCPQCTSKHIQRVWTAPLVMTAGESSVSVGSAGGCGCGTCGCG